MDIVLTTAGIQAVINAQETGTNAVTISEIGVGTGKYTATKEQTQLQAQVKRMPILEGGQAGDNAIHVACKDDGPGSYEVCEFGLFLSDGTLFAVYSQSTPIIAKQESSNLLLAIDMKLEGVNAGNIAFGDVSFSFTAATTANAGIVELATDEETQAGADAQRAVTPAGLRSLTSTAERAGLIRTATEAEAKAGTDKERAVTPAGLKAVVDEATPDASEAARGMIQIASTVEATSGIDALKAMTPATGKAALDARIATVEEAKVGTSTTKLITPATLKAVVDAAVAAALAKQGGAE